MIIIFFWKLSQCCKKHGCKQIEVNYRKKIFKKLCVINNYFTDICWIFSLATSTCKYSSKNRSQIKVSPDKMRFEILFFFSQIVSVVIRSEKWWSRETVTIVRDQADKHLFPLSLFLSPRPYILVNNLNPAKTRIDESVLIREIQTFQENIISTRANTWKKSIVYFKQWNRQTLFVRHIMTQMKKKVFFITYQSFFIYHKNKGIYIL